MYGNIKGMQRLIVNWIDVDTVSCNGSYRHDSQLTVRLDNEVHEPDRAEADHQQSNCKGSLRVPRDPSANPVVEVVRSNTHP